MTYDHQASLVRVNARAQKNPAPLVERAAYTIAEFCAAYRISRSELYNLWGRDAGPRRCRIGTKVIITVEDAMTWARLSASWPIGPPRTE